MMFHFKKTAKKQDCLHIFQLEKPAIFNPRTSNLMVLLDSWFKTDDNFVKWLTFEPSPNGIFVDWPYRPDLKHAPQIDIAGLF